MDGATLTRPDNVGLSSRQLARVDGWMDRLVADGKLPGLSVTIARRGQVAYQRAAGLADIAAATPMAADTIVRIYSMTKPLTSLAVMMLYEEGRFQLDDPVSHYLPCFADMTVAAGGNALKLELVPAQRPITWRHLLTHTSGLTYGFMQATLVDALYRSRAVDFQTDDCSLAEMVERVAALPLLAQPGAEWNYSVATDVLGHLVAVVSGQPFDAFLQERILGPLGMTDTAFRVTDPARFAANYGRGADGRLALIDDPAASPYLRARPIASGGGGLTSTAADYLRFCQFMLNRGELDGVRLVGRKTVELMTANHLRGDMADMGQPRFSESSYEGIGFGLGFSVTLDPAKSQILGSPGEYAWGGAASTAFWIDPVEDMAVVMLTQLMPSSTYPIRRELRVLSYAAVID